ncbi:MAG: N-6 DNA methylase, partial [Chloroflexota bacterium]
MHLLEKYLHEINTIHSTGAAVKETSYYPALYNLLNEVGKELKPKVRCILHPQNKGAGIPDFALFTADQLFKFSDTNNVLQAGLLPSRGVLEVKGTSEDVKIVAHSPQVSKYLKKYRQVLVTNYRDFLLVIPDETENGAAVEVETYHLAQSEATFWHNSPKQAAQEQGDRFIEYLKRAMLRPAAIDSPQVLAWYLASYARDAKDRVEKVSDLAALDELREQLEIALGIKFEGKRGDHFFRSTLIQTLFYGIFSAWVIWCKQTPPTDKYARFSWKEAIWLLHVPMISALFERVVTPSKVGPLQLKEVLDWTGAALNRVNRAAFFSKFEESQAVQYFYEPFLEEFDPALRKELGVWYTPPEIVKYMVARIDTVLKEELGLENGLADPKVYVLDPCTGTGSFLVEVLRKIDQNLKAAGGDALGGSDLKQAALSRIFGFEIIPAPFVIAHLQLNLLLQSLGAPLANDGGERVGVYLTNALTGWEPLDEAKEKLVQGKLKGIEEFWDERDSARQIKREVPILVILGNPPYNAFAGVSPKDEENLVEPYKKGLISEWGIKKFNLDDLYVRFFR